MKLLALIDKLGLSHKKQVEAIRELIVFTGFSDAIVRAWFQPSSSGIIPIKHAVKIHQLLNGTIDFVIKDYYD
jgi:hypothetical protein